MDTPCLADISAYGSGCLWFEIVVTHVNNTDLTNCQSICLANTDTCTCRVGILDNFFFIQKTAPCQAEGYFERFYLKLNPSSFFPTTFHLFRILVTTSLQSMAIYSVFEVKKSNIDFVPAFQNIYM